MEKTPLTPAEQKVQEYIGRIESGESKDSIMNGLPQSFVSSIEAGLAEKAKKAKIEDEAKISAIRIKLGIESSQEKGKYQLVSELIEKVTKGRKQIVLDLYKKLFDEIKNPESRRTLVSGLFKDVYNKYRIADYPIDLDEEKTWENALKNTKVGVNNKKSEWMYRGIFPTDGIETITRGSLNVNVTPELIDALDDMIASGKLKANYKFGQPGTSAAPTERHDSISIYFLEEPSQEILQELGNVIKPYVRGDNLLGKKVSDGFFMSEVGSIESSHVEDFVEEIKIKDEAFAKAVKEYTSPQLGRGESLKMSEAQFYAIKDVAESFGYNISYDKNEGFKIL
jgi:hypothetical protein